ncbi:MAG: GTPase Era [Balneolales bacterium]
MGKKKTQPEQSVSGASNISKSGPILTDKATPPSENTSGFDGSNKHRSGFVGIVGSPNAGKSTLFNRLLGQKLSIITAKAQTTRHRIQGIYSDEESQIVFLDTPGIIQPSYRLQELMMQHVQRLHTDVDLLLHMIDGVQDPAPQDMVYDSLHELALPVMLAVNKTDMMNTADIPVKLEAFSKLFEYVDCIPVSAQYGTGVNELIEKIKTRIPTGPPFYPKDEASDQPIRFFVSELIREQLFLIYRQEIPYSCAVNIVDYIEEEKLDRIHAEIVVNRNSQKGILIGRKGSMMKELGIRSRQSIEMFVGKKVHLDLFVKVREQWRDNNMYLKSYGY